MKVILRAFSRFGFRPYWDSTTTNILNLAACDLLYCLLSTPLFLMQTLSARPLGSVACSVYLFGRWTIGTAISASSAMVAFARCLSLVNPMADKKYFGGYVGLVLVIVVWTYVIVSMLPGYLGVRFTGRFISYLALYNQEAVCFRCSYSSWSYLM